ncbi:hypothetical protein GCM10009539_75440 [Cryptosporangium japonicum]|uniref:Uncharacterized protein n=1 Tax=Cryptosporangium japonicum TaxID=80872 RepID=A0ABP3ETQ4_9ACTN
MSGPLTGSRHPDDVALEVVGQQAPGLLHSTSWRHTGDGLVLTYAALPDPEPQRTAQLIGSRVLAASDDPRRPSPAAIEIEQVAVHACRHLAWLARTDNVAQRVLDGEPALRDAILHWAPAPAGLLEAAFAAR